MQAFQFLLQRLREPSTAAGLAALAYLLGADPAKVDSITQIVVGVAGAAAVFMPEAPKQ